jgi:aldose 1-epimerase
MSFSISLIPKETDTIITLTDESTKCEAEIYSFGALLNKFSIAVNGKHINVIDAFSSVEDATENIVKGFKSAKLSPFVCRLSKGEYKFEGNSYKIDKFYMGDSAIHGLIFDQSFTISDKGADDSKAFVVLAYHYNKTNEGFPFAFDIEVTYALSPSNSLTLTTKVTNTGKTNIPLSDGWHPYFSLGTKVDELLVQFNSQRMIDFDDRLVPTGNYLPYNNFNTSKKFGETFLDNCFEVKETGISACTLKNEKNGLQLNIIPAASYPYLQIYTPAHRNSIAIENLSSAPDAFNNGIGLIIAKPNEEYVFTTTYQLTVE